MMKSTAPLRLLYVEDSPDDAFIVKRCLSKLSPAINFTWLKDGIELLSYIDDVNFDDLSTAPERCILLLDLNLPGLSGFEVVEKLRAHTHERVNKLPIIIFSSSKRVEDVDKCHRLGAQDYLTKSLSYSGMTATIQGLIEKWG